MKPVYEAAHGVEAHMIADLLRREGISGLVRGEYLQGAIGVLPASGLVQVVVDEADYDRARGVIEHWNAAQAEDPPAMPAARPAPLAAAPRWPYFAAGLLLGAFATWVTAGGSGENLADVPYCRP
jgi:hypothetical protein